MTLRSVAVAGVGLITAFSLLALPAQANPEPTYDDAVVSAQTDAEEALAAVEGIFASKPAGVRARALARGERPDATLALRDLWLVKDELSPADQAVANKYLARPVGIDVNPEVDPGAMTGTVTADCSLPTMCVHYTGDATPDRTLPADLATTKTVLQQVHATYAAAGLRAPLPDNGSAAQGGNTKLDVYLMDLKSYGLYGYCANDADLPDGVFTAPVYCVLDNDYAGYGGVLPADALKVTVAHEYFHAVQGAYDWAEDGWLMEGSAAWVEDELYDSINDNLQYLGGSQLVRPNLPLDFFDDFADEPTMSRYGSWVFFRYVSERWAAKGGKPLDLMRRIWERAAALPGGPDDHSTLAVTNVIASAPKVYPGGFARTYNSFAAANRMPKKFYSEGSSYPSVKAPNAKFKKRTKSIATKKQIDRLPHLSSYTIRLTPHKSYKSKKTKLRFKFDLPSRSANPGVTVRTFAKNGKITTTWVSLNAKGDAAKSFGFSSKKVKYLEVTASNGSTAMTCWQGTILACQGQPVHDWLRHKFSAKVVR